MEAMNIGMVAPAFTYFPAYVARDQGLFRARDLEVTIEITGATDKVTTGLQDGSFEIGLVTTDGIVAQAAHGGRLRLVGGNANRAPLSLVARPDVRRIEDLRGRTLGTSSLQEGTAVLTQRMLAAHGLTYPDDYDFAVVGAHPQRWDALQDGRIDAALQLVPYDYIAVEAGYTLLGAAADYVPDYAFGAVAADVDWARAHRAVTENALDAMREAVAWTAEHRDEAADVLVRAAHAERDHARRAVDRLIDGEVTPLDLRIAPAALESIFASVRQAGLVDDGAELSPAMCVDESFLRTR